MERRGFATIASCNYLHFALALARSLRDIHPQAQLHVCVIDPPEHLPERASNVVWIRAEDLGVDHWKRFAFQYGAFELSCALKPYVLKHLLHAGFAQAVYLDADMQIYHDLDVLLEPLRRCSLVLTPHLRSPLPDDNQLPDEGEFLRAGTFNAGFVAVSSSAPGRAFLDWWQNKLRSRCVVNPAEGLFVDQKWLDLAPALFAGVHIDPDPRWNVAYWSLAQLPLTLAGRRYLAGGRPLGLFHFSGWSPNEPRQLSVYHTRQSLDQQPAVQKLLTDYRIRLDQCGREHFERLPYRFATLSDGTPVRDDWRELIRLDWPSLRDIDDPFDVSRSRDLQRRFESAVESRAREADPEDADHPLTRLLDAGRRWWGQCRGRWSGPTAQAGGGDATSIRKSA